MGKYMKKTTISPEVSSTPLVGVRTRAKTLALRRLDQNPNSAAPSSSSSSCYLQLRSRRLEKRLFPIPKTPKTPNSKNPRNPSPAGRGEDDEIEASFGENVVEEPGSTRNSRETTPCNFIRDSESIGTPGSSTRPHNPSITRRVQSSIQRIVPTSREMEDFFSGPEKVQQKAFAEKYNFDPVKGRPLPGRYDWVKLEP